MQAPAFVQPFAREAGNPAGPGVVCLHANASSSSQWRSLIDTLAPEFRVFAPDSYDSGQSPSWPSDRVISLCDEVALIQPLLARAGSPCMLVAHSYGAAIALMAALAHPGRVGALALYEPTLFSLLGTSGPASGDAEGIIEAVAHAADALERGDTDSAARHFIDYWMGVGAWRRTPPARKPAIEASVKNVRRWAHALTTEPTPLAAFGALKMPVLLLAGKQSTRAAHGVVRVLRSALPQVEVTEFEQLGHMGPVTHAEVVNPVIAQFLRRCAARR